MSKITEQHEQVNVTVRVRIEPEPTEAGYSDGPKKAVGLVVSWVWADGAWELQTPYLRYRRVKKDGSLYDAEQDYYLYDKSQAQFADAIEATRPRWAAEVAE